MSLAVVGTMALDNIKTPKSFKKDLLGGSASHFAMSASLFTDVHIVSIVGKDFPTRHMNFLKKKGVDLMSVIEREGPSFRWIGEYKEGDFNTAITLETEIGVLANYAPQVAWEQRGIDNVFMANCSPDVQAEFLSIMDKPKFVGMDSMNLWIKNHRPPIKKLMKKVDLFVVNDGEAKMLSEETNLVKAAKVIHKMGPKYVVVKKGEHGVLFYSDKFTFSFPAFPIENVIDPTGAGDTFAGGLMGYLTKVNRVTESNLRKAVLYATTLASFNVEGFAMQKTAPLTMSDVEKRLKQFVKFATP